MHIGMIVGIGPAATDYYYRQLIAAVAAAGGALELTMAHADVQTLLRHQADGDVAAQTAIYLDLSERLRRAGARHVAVTSIAGHFCIDAYKQRSPLPVIDLLDVVKHEVQQRGLKKVGLLGTRMVMASRFYDALEGVEVVAPDNLLEVPDAYTTMLNAGAATPAQRAIFLDAGHRLSQEHGCESILLAGTDLALVFDEKIDPGFATLDCAAVHAAAIAAVALMTDE